MKVLRKPKKRKKIKFKKITFKISDKQKKLIGNYCKVHKTTPNKLIKKSIKEYIKNNYNPTQGEDYHITKNQLKLFDITIIPKIYR